MKFSLHTIYLRDQGHDLVLPESVSSFFANITNVKIWENEEIIDFIRDNYGREVQNSYLVLKAYAAKADLARVAIINKCGGFYSDINNTILSPLENIVDQKTLIAFRDRNINSLVSWAVQNSFFYSNSNHPILEKYLELAVRNISNRYYGLTPLSPTATSVFGRAFAMIGEIDSVQFGDFVVNNKYAYFQLPSGELVARFKDPSIRGGDSRIIGGNNYNEIWKERNYYSEKE